MNNKIAYINGVLLSGEQDMQPVSGQILFTEGDRIEKILPDGAETAGYEIVDLNGAFRLCYLVGKIMRDKGRGKVINITSNSGEMCNIPSFTPYNVAKAGLNRLTKCLAWEWGPYHINVNAIAPGYTHSNLSAAAPKEVEEELTQKIPYGRCGEPVEIGALAVYLASEASDIMTGAVLTIDGGYSLAR